MPSNAEIARHVLSARKAQAMTQTHLAIAAGISERTVRRAEQTGVVSAENLRAMCAVLGVHLPRREERGGDDDGLFLMAAAAFAAAVVAMAVWMATWFVGGLGSLYGHAARGMVLFLCVAATVMLVPPPAADGKGAPPSGPPWKRKARAAAILAFIVAGAALAQSMG
jgi:hypothetical protein